jgi:hypothetical protein
MMIYTCAGLLMLIKKIVDHFLYRRQQPQGLAHTEKKRCRTEPKRVSWS